MKVLAVLAGAMGLASAHMELKNPPAFRSSYNPYNGGDIDYDIRSPLESGGSDFPCKGAHKLLGTSKGKPVATWSPGGTYSMTITGNTPHKGGSCQASVSFDKGRTFKVVHSYIGNCPVMGDSSYQFTLPNDTPAGEMLFAWSWFNWEGNREMYMNCAAITVKAGGKKRGASDPISSRPNMFVANVGNGICTYEGVDVEFPQPGPDVTRNSRKTKPPGQGSCGWGGNKVQ
ncbi:extracellular protein [Purpureocillium lavendulum]|uniref:Extracellular protein n=1 Tax=Purpureocillium lavendulum TaxID=1247861 RepID=A0AB34FTC2_9HYPO|nr:extracellular protein [Purpureocillium lavendulum]